MNSDAKRENMRALASALGIAEDLAGTKLDFKVELLYSKNNSDSKFFSAQVLSLLSRTVERVETTASDISCLAVIRISGNQEESLYITLSNDCTEISDQQNLIEKSAKGVGVHPLFLLLTACYTCSAIIKAGVPEIPFASPLPIKISFKDVADPLQLEETIDLGTAYMAGAGAIGNAFLWALSYLDVQGELHICDDDKVSGGNLNRQIFFDADDISKYKSECLAKKAQSRNPGLKLLSRKTLLQDLPEAGDDFWLDRLISAVDSRRARRTIQGQFPREVFDASTTDITEIVVHYHKQPTEKACLACIYYEDLTEKAHEQNIAEALNVGLEEVKTERISAEVANKIVDRFPDAGIAADAITGEAYDSLYKSLCGQGKLEKSEEQQVLAPFCFVSMLAGAMLAFEIVNRLDKKKSPLEYNTWKVGAWVPPFVRMKRDSPRKADCQVCSSSAVKRLLRNKFKRP